MPVSLLGPAPSALLEFLRAVTVAGGDCQLFNAGTGV